MQMLPQAFQSLPELPTTVVRDLAYLRSRILDQEMMMCLAKVVEHYGATIFKTMLKDILATSITSYCSIVHTIIGNRLTALLEPHRDEEEAEETILDQPTAATHRQKTGTVWATIRQ